LLTALPPPAREWFCQLAAGMDGIEVGEGDEMALLALKRSKPEEAFRLLEALAQQLQASR
jgi:hypothetical protein